MQPSALEPRLEKRDDHRPRFVPYARLSDVELVSKATSGDRRALDALVERHSPRVQRLAAQLMGDLEDARDAAQESLVKLCTRLRQFRGEAQFGTWLHRLVVNTCRDRMAYQRIRETDVLDPGADFVSDEADPSDAALSGVVRAEIRDALARLSPNQRLAVVLRDALGLSYEEIARVVSIPVGTAKSYVHRARARLRARLEGLALE